MKLLNDYFLKILFFLMISFLISCEKEETMRSEPRLYTSLIINNYHRWYGNPSWQDNFIFEIYKSRNDFDSYFSVPYDIKGSRYFPPYYLLDPTLEKDNDLYCESLRYDSIKSGTYYVKIFNAYNDDKFVEFNEPYSITISEPLDSVTVLNTLTERYFINSFTIKKMEINFDNNEYSNDANSRVSVKFWKFYPSGYAGPPPTVFFEDSVLVSSFPYRKTSLSINISEFNSWWCDPYFFIEISGKSYFQQYEVKIFDLLNLNKRLSDSLVYFDSKQNIRYKLYGEWSIK